MPAITRIVRLSFDPQYTEAFLKIFNDSYLLIRSFPGCNHLALHQDLNQSHIYYTISKWEAPDDLENYRKSELFIKTWAQTKALFNAKPEVFTLVSASQADWSGI